MSATSYFWISFVSICPSHEGQLIGCISILVVSFNHHHPPRWFLLYQTLIPITLLYYCLSFGAALVIPFLW